MSLAALEIPELVSLWAWPVGLAALTIAASIGMRRLASRRPAGRRVPFQVAVLATSVVGLLAVLLSFPIQHETRGQILGFLGIVLSASIALSSTTILGNLLAGIMLRLVREFRVGDFVRVEEIFGRVTERGLIHTEIQTEDRDLTTLPNLYLVSHPLTIVRASGTILSTKVSLGYDLSHQRVEEALLAAAGAAGLEHPFVQLLELGDFSVTYRIAGLFEEVQAIVSARSKLNVAVLDELHAAGIEIVSPTFMNTRPVQERVFIPAEERREEAPEAEPEAPEAVIFDKAEEVAALAEREEQLVDLKERLAELDKADTTRRAALEQAVAKLEQELEERHGHLDEAK